jgi:hypothetical protein
MIHPFLDGLDEKFVVDYWNKSKMLLEEKTINMTDTTFFRYQIVKK